MNIVHKLHMHLIKSSKVEISIFLQQISHEHTFESIESQKLIKSIYFSFLMLLTFFNFEYFLNKRIISFNVGRYEGLEIYKNA